MKKKNRIAKRLPASLLAAALALFMGAGALCVETHAASGAVYTCEIVRCYRHPVSGIIEDSGGEGSYATGLGMVEGAVYDYGLMEVTADGSYYLTFKMSLIDYCSDHAFLVQNVGDSSWSEPSECGVTAMGTDSNGTTYNICVKVPSENCIVRFTMYVGPMSRNVVGYFYPTNYTSGNSTQDMSPAIVSESSDTSGSGSDTSATGSDTSGTGSGTSGSGSDNSGASSSTSGGTQSAASGSTSSTGTTSSGTTSAGTTSSGSTSSTGGEATSSSGSSGSSSAEESGSETEAEKEAAAAATEETASAEEEEGLSINSIMSIGTGSSDTASADTTESSGSSELSSAQGLSLSTEGETSSSGESEEGAQEANPYILAVVITLCVLAVIFVIAAIGFIFRKNWYKWGRKDLYEYDDEDYEE